MAAQNDSVMTGERNPSGEPQSRVSRRAFLKAGGAGAVTGAVAASVLFENSTAHAQARWDHEADVVVAGSGSAASVAALFAQQAGASVIIVEKARIYGGTSAKSGGVFWIPNNHLMRKANITDKRDDLLRYLARTAYPTLFNPADAKFGMPDDVHQLHAAFYDQAAPTIDALLAMGFQCIWQSETFGDQKPYPDYYAHLPENKAPRGRALKPPPAQGLSGGAALISQLRNLVQEKKIQVLLNHPVERLVVNGSGEIVGVEARTDAKTVTIRARKGVIFGTGGFTSNEEMCRAYLRGRVFGGCTVPTGQGDFVRIASGVRAKLGNMNSAWWWPVMVEEAIQNRSTSGGIAQIPGDSSILVNCEGRRCVNEKIQYHERTRAHFDFDSFGARYPNHIMIMVYDQSCRERFGGNSGLVVKPGLNAPYVLSADTLEQLAAVVDRRLAQIADKTGNFRLDSTWAATLKDTIARYNQFATTGKDLDFHRGETPIEFTYHGGDTRGNTFPNLMMRPIAATGPYYAVLIGAGTLDTNGGPKINSKSEVLDVDEKPIPGLYGAGNCIAAPAGEAYWAAGATIGSAMTFGAIAGRNAAAAPVKQERTSRTASRV